MKKLQFLILIHNHQPLGNFDYVFEDAYKKSYKPFLDVFKKYDIKISLHLSGPLFDWLLENHPEYIDEIKYLVKKGNIEIICSGYYEPILTAIPQRDAIDQLKSHKERLENVFDTNISGAWLTERVWEPHLPSIFDKAGVKYITLDDYHFLRSGLSQQQLDGYYLTDFEDSVLAVYPGSETLRYIMPFSTLENIASYFKKIYDEGLETIVFADDGEKFGIWPETYKWVYEERWLDKFFSFLEENKNWIITKKINEHYNMHEPKGLCYFPTTSYPELGEWALPSDMSFQFKKALDWLKENSEFAKIKPFFQGGQWKNFLSKYKESLVISRKMFYLSKLIKDEDISQKKELFKSQCNDAYWHGVFGGLYLPHLRREIQSHLAKGLAQVLPSNRVLFNDFDLDGKEECLVHNSIFTALFDCNDGGTLLSLDFHPKSLNLTDVLTRRKEAYHMRLSESSSCSQGTKTIHEQFISKEEGLERILYYDKFTRASGRIHFFDNISFEDIYKHTCNFHKFSTIPFDFISTESKNYISIELTASYDKGKCKKICHLKDNTITYHLSGNTEKPYKYIGFEWNINLFAPNSPDRYISIDDKLRLPLNAYGNYQNINNFLIKDLWYGLFIEVVKSDFDEVFIYPVETVSLSEAGIEKTFQGTCIFFLGKLINEYFDKHFSLKVDIIN